MRIPALFLVSIACISTWQAEAAVPAGKEQRAYLNRSCIISDEPFLRTEDGQEEGDQVTRSLPLAGIVVGKLVNALVSGAVRATAGGLDAVSKHKDMHYLAANNVNLYRANLADSPGYAINDQLACATVVVADFANDSDCTDQYFPRQYSDDGSLPESWSVENTLRRANICVSGTARSVYEFRFTLSQDGTAYRLETAGMWVNGLISTNKEKVRRSLIYTLDILEPASDTDPSILSTAFVNIGDVYPGLVSDDPLQQVRSDWLQVPAMSRRATNAYERDTSVHNDVHAEIGALERAVVRNKRLLDGLNRRMESASGNVRASLEAEAESVEFKMLRAESLLDAKRAEYNDLPQSDLHYMPITVRLGIIESRSQKRALNALATVLEGNKAFIADTASATLGYERSLDIPDTEPTELEMTRAAYFDALVNAGEARESSDANLGAAEDSLLTAKEQFNTARLAAGIPEIN